MIMTIGCIQFFDRLYTILQKNGGTDTKPKGKTEPQFLSDPMSDRKKSFANSATECLV